MADIQALRAFRYNLGRVGALSDVIAPPYDVIDPELQGALYDKSPYNVVRLILNKEEPSDSGSNNRYTRAAGYLRDWQHEGVLVQDSARGLYVYHQEFEVEGRRYTRKGFLARARLVPFGQGQIYAHEETMPGPKADRLRLFHATGMNLSPIFGLYPDPDGAVQGQLDEAVRGGLPLESRDHLGVVSRLWPISDQHIVTGITARMEPKPIFIADGHHRYETSLRYMEDCRGVREHRDAEANVERMGSLSGQPSPHERGLEHDAQAAFNFTLMMLVSMQDAGLVILPTHRLVSGLPDLTANKLHGVLAGDFELKLVGEGERGARDAWSLIETDGGQEMLGFGTTADGLWQTARLRNPNGIAQFAGEHSAAWRGLAVSILHVLVLDRLLPGALGCQPRCQYVHLLGDVTTEVAARNCQLAVLVPPATMEHVEKIAGNLEKMPPKSTYFYPKLLSGLVFNSLKGN
jgi:uncharacterized protein (DUF1015 family)